MNRKDDDFYHVIIKGNEDESIHGGSFYPNLESNKQTFMEKTDIENTDINTIIDETDEKKTDENSGTEVNGSDKNSGTNENGSDVYGNDEKSGTNENGNDVNGNDEKSGTNENDNQFKYIIENNTIDDFLTIFIEDFKKTIASFVFNIYDIFVTPKKKKKWIFIYLLVFILFVRICVLEHKIKNTSSEFYNYINHSLSIRDKRLQHLENFNKKTCLSQ